MDPILPSIFTISRAPLQCKWLALSFRGFSFKSHPSWINRLLAVWHSYQQSKRTRNQATPTHKSPSFRNSRVTKITDHLSDSSLFPHHNSCSHAWNKPIKKKKRNKPIKRKPRNPSTPLSNPEKGRAPGSASRSLPSLLQTSLCSPGACHTPCSSCEE